MFEFIRTHQRLMQFVLLLLIFPSFAFFGLEGYTRIRDGDHAKNKNFGKSISDQFLDAAQRQQMDRLRQMFGDRFDPKMFDTPEARHGILDNLIAQKALAAEASRDRLTVSDQSLQQTILGIPGLTKPDGKFDSEQFKSLLAMQGLTPATFEARLLQDMAMQQVIGAIQTTAFAPKTVAAQLSAINEQEREVQEMQFKAADYASQVKVTAAMLKDYYDKHPKLFEIPEQAKAEYVILNSDAIASQMNISDADLKSYYDQNLKRYTNEEQRRASHILIAVGKNASAADKTAAKEKAERLLAQLRKNPADFAKLAKENSQDPGSAARGGDLGFFGKGMMVKQFEDAAFKLKQGEISDVVASDFGYHIIQLTGIKPASVKSFDEAKGEIAAEIKKQQAAKKYADMAETFSNSVYEQPDSLKPAADKLKLKIETASNLTRAPNPSIAPTAPYNNPKFLKALFSDDVIKNKHNTEAVEVAPNTMIAGHVIEYKPVSKKPFDEVKAMLKERVVQEEAAALAKKAGETKLAEIKAKPDAPGFGQSRMVSRTKNPGLEGPAYMDVMKADVTKLPSFVGVDLHNQGYAIYRISKVVQPAVVDNARRQAERQQVANALAQQETLAYIDVLKIKAKDAILRPQVSASEENGNSLAGI